MDDWKEQWKLLRAELRELQEHRRALLAPTQAAYDRLEERLDEISDGKGWVRECSGCSKPICDLDPVCRCYDDGDLCLECAPSYQDIIDSSGDFINYEDEPMTPEQAQALVQQHIDAGGTRSDKLVFPPMINGIITREADD